MKTINQKIPIGIAVFGFLYLLIYNFWFFDPVWCYDEIYYFKNLPIIQEYGLGYDFLVRLKGPSGPLHAYLHHFLLPLTDGSPPLDRFVNIILGVLLIYLLYRTIELVNKEKTFIAYLTMAVPMAFVTMGMALTELPALVFIVFGLYTTLRFIQAEEVNSKLIALLLLGAFSFSVGLAGRQTYLPCLVVLVATSFYFLKSNKRWFLWIFSGVALLFPLMLFAIWEGLIPNSGSEIVYAKSYSVYHLLLGIGYSALTLTILCPLYFIKLNKRFQLLYAMLFLLNIVISWLFSLTFTPMNTLVQSIFPPALATFYGFFMGAVLLTAAVYLVHTVIIRMKEHKDDMIYVTTSLMMLAVLFTCIKITHTFSSRYVFQALPFFLILITYHYKQETKFNFIHLLGMLLGMIILPSYC